MRITPYPRIYLAGPGKENPLPATPDPWHEPPEQQPATAPKRKKKNMCDIVMH